jgi:hypothetical protein
MRKLPWAEIALHVARSLVLAVLLILLGLFFFKSHPVNGQVTIPNSFTNGTTADADQVNANFTALGTQSLNRTGGTMTGTMSSQAIQPSSSATYDLGAVGLKYKDLYLSGDLKSATTTITGTATANAFNGTITPTQLTGAGRIPQGADYWPAFTTKTTTYTILATDDDIDCDATSAGFTLTLPTPVGITGKQYDIKKIDLSANVCTVGTAAGTIDGASTFPIGVQYQNMTFRSNGTNWDIR